MKIGSKYKFQEVAVRHFEELGESIGFKPEFVRKQIYTISNDIAKAAAALHIELNKDPKTASGIYEKIVKVIAKHHNRMLSS